MIFLREYWIDLAFTGDFHGTQQNGDLKTQLFQKCSLVLHAYFGRDMDTFAALLDKDFVGIGSYKAQFTKGIQEFLAVSHNEQMEPPAEVYDEEYQILLVSRIYGLFTDSFVLLHKEMKQ